MRIKIESSYKLYMYALIEIVILIMVWQLLSSLRLLPEYLSNPLKVGYALWEMTVSGQLVDNASLSLKRSLTGFLLVAVAGIVFGVIAGYYKKIGDLFDPVVALFNPLPKIALMPLFLVWFGVSETTRILIIFCTAFFPVFIATLDGVRSVNKLLVWSGMNMGASSFRILVQVILPASLSKIFDGLRIALGLSFVMMFSSELIGTSNGLGLGFLILKADTFGQVDVMFAAVIVIAALGCLFDFILQSIRKRVLWWTER